MWACDPYVQLPDPIDLGDIRWWADHLPRDPDSLLASIYEAVPIEVPHESPKANSENRRMVVFSPYASLRVRGALSPHTRVLLRHQVEPTYANCLLPYGQTFCIESFSRSHKRFREDLEHAIGAGKFHGGIKTDVRQCYPSITADAVAEVLAYEQVPSESVRVIREALERSAHEVHTGLPIGPEFSGLLANLVFRKSDRRLNWNREASVTLRWGDDHSILASHYLIAVDQFGVLRECLAHYGLQLNVDKTKTFWNQEELFTLRYSDVGSLPAVANVKPWQLSAGRLEEKLRTELLSEWPSTPQLRFLFKTLINKYKAFMRVMRSKDFRRPATVVDLLLTYPEKWRFAPAEGSAYLRHFMDLDDAVRAVDTTVGIADAGFPELALHLIRATIGFPLERDQGRRLIELARRTSNTLLAGTARGRAAAPEMGDLTWRETIESGEFECLSPFEQRWMIGAAQGDARKLVRWLDSVSRTSPWVVTLDWRRSLLPAA